MRSVLILGGYGNFGKRIAEALAKEGIKVIIAGRNNDKAEALVKELGTSARSAVFDANTELVSALDELKPYVLINTCGPFQTADYRIAETCIDKGVHYIDLADARDFVTGITSLAEKAKAAGVMVISGASTVPGLSSAVLEHYKDEFSEIEELTFGISPGQRAERGLATTKGILSYVGKRLKPFAGHSKAYGWQDVYRQEYPGLGKRWMANCDIPDLDLLPARYGIKSILFSAGLELGIVHIGLWAISWLVRMGLPLNLPRYATLLLALADMLNRFGSADGGMHMVIKGKGIEGRPHERKWFIIAKDGYGPQIPSVPAILLAKQLVTEPNVTGNAMTCLGLVSLTDYLAALQNYPIFTKEF